MKNAFRLWLGSRFFSSLAKQIQSTVVAWQVFTLTHDPLAVGLLGLVWALPFSGIALWAGHLVDQHEKRQFMLRAEIGFMVCAAALLANGLRSAPSLYVVYGIVAFSGFCASFENISFSAYSQILISKEKFPRAMGWNLGFFQATVVCGPLLAGWLLRHVPATAIYALVGSLFLVSFVIALKLPLMPALSALPGASLEGSLERIKSGLKFICSQPLMLAAMSLDMVAVLFGDVVALYPFFADRLGAGSLGFGFLKAAPGLGSGLISAVQATRPFVRPSWLTLRVVVTLFGVCIILFALSPNIYLAALFLALGGASDGISVIVRQSIYQAHTPDHFRGRVAAVSSIFIATSNEIGEFESGLAARLMGVVPSVLLGGAICLSSVGIMSRIFRGRIKEVPLPQPNN
ncbi:MAG: Enterobactin exporter EntS [Elusimicrobia bacterium]|nr:Enterobactin exporter EntS [Elusimicrobiota bacterium]